MIGHVAYELRSQKFSEDRMEFSDPGNKECVVHKVAKHTVFSKK